MPDNNCLFTFYTLTPLHAGAGDSARAIDLPVQREKHTDYPVVYSSGIKGSLRCFSEFNSTLKPHVKDIFGDEGKEGSSGRVIFTDAKILLFPVRSSEGVFKWVTCPFVVERLRQDLKFIDIPKDDFSVTIDNLNAIAFNRYENVLILEDFPITVYECPAPQYPVLEVFKTLTADHFNESYLTERLIIVSDDIFKTLVTTATQIIARNKLKENKISDNLWYEEVVPADAVFYTIMKPTTKSNEAVIKRLEIGISECTLQIGGNETVGYGFVKMSRNLSDKFIQPEVTNDE